MSCTLFIFKIMPINNTSYSYHIHIYIKLKNLIKQLNWVHIMPLVINNFESKNCTRVDTHRLPRQRQFKKPGMQLVLPGLSKIMYVAEVCILYHKTFLTYHVVATAGMDDSESDDGEYRCHTNYDAHTCLYVAMYCKCLVCNIHSISKYVAKCSNLSCFVMLCNFHLPLVISYCRLVAMCMSCHMITNCLLGKRSRIYMEIH